jgi:hypothetical protein
VRSLNSGWLAGVSGEGGAGAVVGEHVVEDVDEGGACLMICVSGGLVMLV